MGNTALRAIIGADASPFQRAMATVATVSTNTAQVTIRELQRAAAELDKLAAAGGRGSQFYRDQLGHVNAELARMTALEQQAVQNADRLAEARARIAAGRGRAADRALIPETPLTGSEVPRTTNNAGRMAALRAEYEEKKRIKALDAERSGLVSGDMVTRTTPDTARLARLRAMMSGSTQEQFAARMEIRELSRMRAAERAKSGVLGNLSGIGTPAQMFISVARDASASLASGASPWKVFLQQAPQVAQAFTMMQSSALAFFKTMLMSPVTWFVAGLVALGAAAAMVVSHFKTVAERLQNLKDMTDLTNRSFVDQIRILTEAVGAQREYVSWLKKQAEAQEDVKKATEEALHASREKYKLEREIAANRGTSPRSLAQMDIEQTRRELAILNEAVDKARQQKHDAFADAAEAHKSQQAFMKGTGPVSAAALATVNDKVVDNAKIADAAKEAMRNTWVKTGRTITRPGQVSMIPEVRQANETDPVQFEVGGKKYNQSVAESAAKLEEVRQKQVELDNVNKELENLAKDKKTIAEKDKARFNDLVDQRDQLQSDLGLKEKYAVKAAMKGEGGGYRNELTSNQRVGAYIGGPEMSMLYQQKITNQHLKEIRDRIGKPGGNQPPTIGGMRTK